MMNAPLGQIALDRGWISQEQLDQALARQQQIAASEPNRFRRIGHLLIKQGALTPAQVAELLKAQGIVIYRNTSSGKQYNVHRAVATQTYLSPDDSSPMEIVAASEIEKVIVFDDINRAVASDAPLQRMVAPPGALQAETHRQAIESPPTPPKKPAAQPTEADATPSHRPTMEQILARSADAKPKPQRPAVEDGPPVAAPSESDALGGLNFDFDVDSVPAPAEPPSLFGATDSEEDASYASDFAITDSDEPSEINIFAPRGNVGLGAGDEEIDRGDVDLDQSALISRKGRKGQEKRSAGDELFPPLERADAPPPPPPPASVEAVSVPLELVGDVGVGIDVGLAGLQAGAAPTLDSAQAMPESDTEGAADVQTRDQGAALTPIWEQIAGDDAAEAPLPPPPPEEQPAYGAASDGPAAIWEQVADAPPAAHGGDEIADQPPEAPDIAPPSPTPAPPPDFAEVEVVLGADDDEEDSGFGQFELDSLGDGNLSSVGLDELQAPPEQIEYDSNVAAPDAFPDLAPGSTSIEYAVDDAPEPEGAMLGESLIDGGLTRPQDGFNFDEASSDDALLTPPPPALRSEAIPVKPLEDSTENVSPQSDASAEEPVPVESAEVRRITGSFDRSRIESLDDLDEFEEIDDEESNH